MAVLQTILYVFQPATLNASIVLLIVPTRCYEPDQPSPSLGQPDQTQTLKILILFHPQFLQNKYSISPVLISCHQTLIEKNDWWPIWKIQYLHGGNPFKFLNGHLRNKQLFSALSNSGVHNFYDILKVSRGSLLKSPSQCVLHLFFFFF